MNEYGLSFGFGDLDDETVLETDASAAEAARRSSANALKHVLAEHGGLAVDVDLVHSDIAAVGGRGFGFAARRT